MTSAEGIKCYKHYNDHEDPRHLQSGALIHKDDTRQFLKSIRPEEAGLAILVNSTQKIHPERFLSTVRAPQSTRLF
jgi:hypothetical protein